jgi:arylsulfatase A-like enzyme
VILVVTGENGEAFHENGEIGHACNPVEPVIHVAAVIYAPDLVSPRVEDYPFEHVDLAPTLCGLLGVEAAKNFQGIDILAEDRPPADDRLLFVHVLSPIARADAVLRGGRWKYVVSRDRPQGVLFDIVADPEERADLSGDKPELAAELAQVLVRWRQQQLAYYHYPQYYGRYSPPQPPGRLPGRNR